MQSMFVRFVSVMMNQRKILYVRIRLTMRSRKTQSEVRAIVDAIRFGAMAI